MLYSAALTTAWPAANRRSHLDWTDADMKTVGAGGAVGAGTEHTGAGGERAADTVYAHELGPHRCDAADDVGSYLVRNTPGSWRTPTPSCGPFRSRCTTPSQS